jgi:hypothetical protein
MTISFPSSDIYLPKVCPNGEKPYSKKNNKELNSDQVEEEKLSVVT